MVSNPVQSTTTTPQNQTTIKPVPASITSAFGATPQTHDKAASDKLFASWTPEQQQDFGKALAANPASIPKTAAPQAQATLPTQAQAAADPYANLPWSEDQKKQIWEAAYGKPAGNQAAAAPSATPQSTATPQTTPTSDPYANVNWSEDQKKQIWEAAYGKPPTQAEKDKADSEKLWASWTPQQQFEFTVAMQNKANTTPGGTKPPTGNGTSPWGNVVGGYAEPTGGVKSGQSVTADAMSAMDYFKPDAAVSSGMSDIQVKQMQSAAMAGMDPRGLEQMQAAIMSGMDPREVEKMQAAYMGGMDPREVEKMKAASAAQNNRTVASNEMSSTHLNDILSQDSPLMSLARQTGIDYSQRRGTANSSLAGGAAMAEMARQATPLAMQQAEAHRAAQTQNQQLESSRREANAGREQQSNMFNADSTNQARSQDYSTEAARREANAGRDQQSNAANANAANQALDQEYSLEALRREANAGRDQQASAANADAANAAASQTYTTEAARREANAGRDQQTGALNAEAENRARQQEFESEAARREANAGREQQSNMQGADAANEAQRLAFQAEAERRRSNADMQTNTNVQNAAMSNDMLAKERSNSLTYAMQQLQGDQEYVRQNSVNAANMALQKLAGDQDYAKQAMASNLSKELANIEGEHKKFISNNDSAARVMTGYMDSINDILSNKDMKRDEALKRVEDMMGGLKDSLNVMSAVSGMDLSSVLLSSPQNGGSQTTSVAAGNSTKSNTRGANS